MTKERITTNAYEFILLIIIVLCLIGIVIKNAYADDQALMNAAVMRRNDIIQSSIYVEQVGHNNTYDIGSEGTRNMLAGLGSNAMSIQGDWNTIITRQGNFANTLGKNLIEANLYGYYNSVNLKQGQGPNDLGGHMQSIAIAGDNNILTTEQRNSSSYGHYLSTNITGNNNTQNINQSGNAIKQMFVTTTGNNNNVSVLQDGLGAHEISMIINGNSNDAVVSQTGNTKNSASITLTNAGSPASITLNQTGGQTYSIDRLCSTLCGRVIVSQP